MKSLFLNTICLLFFFQLVFAQGERLNNSFDKSNTSLFDTKEGVLYIASNLYENTTSRELLNHQLVGNNVQIQQIGDNNNVSTLLKANKIDVSVLQKGNENLVAMDKQANAITQRVIQEGQNNAISDFSLYSKYDVNMELIQQGNNQNIKNFGTNSISKNMKVIQSGNGASVIIINNNKP